VWRTGFKEPRSSESRNLVPAEKPMKPIERLLVTRSRSWVCSCVSRLSTYGPATAPAMMYPVMSGSDSARPKLARVEAEMVTNAKAPTVVISGNDAMANGSAD